MLIQKRTYLDVMKIITIIILFVDEGEVNTMVIAVLDTITDRRSVNTIEHIDQKVW